MSSTPAREKDRSRPRFALRGLALGAGAMAALSGCNSTMVPSTAILSREEFTRTVEFRPELAIPAPDTIAAAPGAVTVMPPVGSPDRITLTGPIAASSGISDVGASAGQPERTPAPTVVSSSVFVDAKIGDINGKAIYASDFLETMSDRLRAEAAKQPRAEWMKFARTEISRELDTMIEDELLTAEALASFTPEQKAGFFAFVQQLSRRMTSENLGSRTLTEQRARESEGKSLDEIVADRRDAELVKFQLQQRIYKKVNVSWRDIQQTYERFFDEFNPPPKYRFRLIQLQKDNAAALDTVTKGLASGEAFDKLALTDDNLAYYAKKESGAIREVTQAKEPGKTVYFVNKELNSTASQMTAGEVRGPIATDPTVTWLKLEEVVTQSVALYDAQLRIESFLRNNRNEIERRRYINRLRQRASITDVREMTDRLMAIAVDRFYPDENAGAPR